MVPVLFNLGPITIYAYGFFLALAFLWGSYVFLKEGKKQGYQEEKLIDFSIVSLIAALVGGRILYVLINLEQFANDPMKILSFWEGGFAYFGSLIFVLVAGTYLVRKWRWSFLQIADIASLAALAATVLAKIGSFLSGNDYGSVTSLPWGVGFDYLEGLRHPIQLIDAFYSFLLFLVLFKFYKQNINSTNFRSGSTFFYFLFFSGAGRFVFEFLRGDSSFVGPVKLAHILSLILAAVALFSLYFYQFRDFKSDKENISKYLFGFGRVRKVFKRSTNEPRTF